MKPMKMLASILLLSVLCAAAMDQDGSGMSPDNLSPSVTSDVTSFAPSSFSTMQVSGPLVSTMSLFPSPSFTSTSSVVVEQSPLSVNITTFVVLSTPSPFTMQLPSSLISTASVFPTPSVAITSRSEVRQSSSVVSSTSMPSFVMTGVTMTSIVEDTITTVTIPLSLSSSFTVAIASSSIEVQVASSSSVSPVSTQSTSTMATFLPTSPTPPTRVTVIVLIILEEAVLATIAEIRIGVADLLNIDEGDIDKIYLYNNGVLVYPERVRREIESFTFDGVEVDLRVTLEEMEQVETRAEVINESDTDIMIGDMTISIVSLTQTPEEMSSTLSSTPASSLITSSSTRASSLPPTSSTQAVGTDVPESGLAAGAVAGIVLALTFLILVVVVLVIILVVYFRRKTFTKSYEFDAAEMTYMKNSDVWKSDIPPD